MNARILFKKTTRAFVAKRKKSIRGKIEKSFVAKRKWKKIKLF